MSEELKDALDSLRTDPLSVLLDECVCRMLETDQINDARACYRAVAIVMEVLSEFDFDIARTDLIIGGTGLIRQRTVEQRPTEEAEADFPDQGA